MTQTVVYTLHKDTKIEIMLKFSKLNASESKLCTFSWTGCCSNSPTLHNEVKDLYIAAVKAAPQDVDADVQVSYCLLLHFMLVTINFEIYVWWFAIVNVN